MHAKLVVVAPKEHSGEHTVNLPAVLGRGREATLKLLHPLVSRKHCEIRQSGDHLVVRDLGSLNGTFIGRQRVEGQAELPSGELLTLGGVTLKAVYEHRAGTLGGADATTVLGAATISNLREPKVVPNQAVDEMDDLSLSSDEDRGHSPAAMETDWLDESATSGAETLTVQPGAAETFRDEPREESLSSLDEAESGATTTGDDLPAVSFEESGEPAAATSTTEAGEVFDPLDFLDDSPAPAAAEAERRTAEGGDELESTDFEPMSDSDVAPRAGNAASGLQDEDIELEPLDVPEDQELEISDEQVWNLSEDDASEQPGGKEQESDEPNARKKEDDDLDDFLKNFK